MQLEGINRNLKPNPAKVLAPPRDELNCETRFPANPAGYLAGWPFFGTAAGVASGGDLWAANYPFAIWPKCNRPART